MSDVDETETPKNNVLGDETVGDNTYAEAVQHVVPKGLMNHKCSRKVVLKKLQGR